MNSPLHSHRTEIKDPFLELEATPVRVTVIGFGGCGQNSGAYLADTINPKSNPHLNIVLANTAIRSLRAVPDAPYAKHFRAWHALAAEGRLKPLQLGKNVTKGHGSGQKPEIGKKAFEESKAEIQAIVDQSDVIIAICGLGKGTGTGCSISFSELMAKNPDKIAMAILIFPHAELGAAEVAANAYKEVSDKIPTICIYNQRIYQLYGKESLQKSYEKIVLESSIGQVTHMLAEMIQTVGLKETDARDLKTILETGNYVATGYAQLEAHEKDERCVQKVLKTFQDPFQNPAVIKYAKAFDVLFKGNWSAREMVEIIEQLRKNKTGVMVCEGYAPNSDPNDATKWVGVIAVAKELPSKKSLRFSIPFFEPEIEDEHDSEPVAGEIHSLTAVNHQPHKTTPVHAPKTALACATNSIQKSSLPSKKIRRSYIVDGETRFYNASDFLWQELDRMVVTFEEARQKFEETGVDERNPDTVLAVLEKIAESEKGRAPFINSVLPSLAKQTELEREAAMKKMTRFINSMQRGDGILRAAKRALGRTATAMLAIVISYSTFAATSHAEPPPAVTPNFISIQKGQSPQEVINAVCHKSWLGYILLKNNIRDTRTVKAGSTIYVPPNCKTPASDALAALTSLIDTFEQRITQSRKRIKLLEREHKTLEERIAYLEEIRGTLTNLNSNLAGSNQLLKHELDSVSEELTETKLLLQTANKHKENIQQAFIIAMSTLALCWGIFFAYGWWEQRTFAIWKARRKLRIHYNQLVHSFDFMTFDGHGRKKYRCPYCDAHNLFERDCRTHVMEKHFNI